MLDWTDFAATAKDQPWISANSSLHMVDVHVLALRVEQDFFPEIVFRDHALIGEHMLDRERDISFYCSGLILDIAVMQTINERNASGFLFLG